METLALNSGLWMRRLFIGESPVQGRCPVSEVNDGGCPEKPDHLTFNSTNFYMRPQPAVILFCIAIVAASLCGPAFWLAIPMLLQVIVDKAIGQNSPDTLRVLGLVLLVVTLLASSSEMGIGILSRLFDRDSLIPMSFRLPLTVVVLSALWYGAFQVLAGQLLLGQWLAVGVLSPQFAASLLTFTMTSF